MGWISKIGWLVFTIVIIVALLYFFDEPTFCNTLANVMNPNISSKICGSQIYTNNPIIMKEQHNFTTAEIKAIAQSSPITINPANAVFFGTWENMSHMLCAKEQDNFSLAGTSQLNVLYNGYYVPIYVNVQALGNSAPNLIGQKVYLDFVINNNESISAFAPYIVKTEIIKNNIEYWNFTFDRSTNNAINSMLNLTTANITESYLNGIILSNHTPLISPLNPDIPYTAPSC